MDRQKIESRFFELWAEIEDLSSAESLLEWDQETHMPAAAQEGRGKVLATIAGLLHRQLTSQELADVLAAAEELAAPEGLLAAQVRCARYEVDRARRIPERLARELAEAKSRALVTWKEARRQADFGHFAPDLARLVALKQEEGMAVLPGGPVYDALLDKFEPGSTEAQLTPLFDDLRDRLVPLVRSVVESGVVVDESPAHGDFPEAAQLAFGRAVAQAIGFDFERGRLDLSTHPFCIGIHQDDVRITWRYLEDDFRSALFGILHECGHGLYEQGLPAAWKRTPAGEAFSLGIHESQSRLWENHVGRSRGFWRWALGLFERCFPGTRVPQLADLWPTLHTIKPSLIRVEADEATYNLHIVLRYELERALFDGRLEVADLAAAWDDLSEELLGIRPPNAAEGVLQDTHWAFGLFGYFPTYTLGTLTAAQLFTAAERDLGDLEEAMAKGDFAPLLGWLRRHVHRHGGRRLATEIVEEATGRPLEATDLLRYLEAHMVEVYSLS